MNKAHQGSGRIPGLDGLRACSILCVVWSHMQTTRGFPECNVLSWAGDLGNLGVRVFFVISGFLITHLLLDETRLAGRISLKGFYLRRTFRIFPAFYTFLLVVTLLVAAGMLAAKTADLAHAATYTINFVHKKSWVVAHAWSLAVEEQFYLLWPMTIVLLGWAGARRVAIGAVLMAPVLRIATWYLLPQYQGIITKAFPTICDTIATGCLLACFREQVFGLRWYRAFVDSRWFLMVPAAVLLSNSQAWHTRPDLLLGHTVRNVGIALCIDWCLRHSDSRLGRFLSLRPMVWVGTLSYSLYLWQQVFLNRNSDVWYCAFPLNVTLAFMVASLSLYLVERPCLRLRVRWFPEADYRSTSRQRREGDHAVGGAAVSSVAPSQEAGIG